MDKITWRNDKRKLSDLIPWEINPAQIGKDEARRLEESLDEFGQVQAIAISPTGEIYDGHQRKTVWSASKKFGKDYVVDVRVSSRPLTEQERKKLVIYLRKGAVGEFDWDILANNFDVPDLLEWGFTEQELQLGGFDLDGDKPEDPGAQIDKADELRQKWQTETGQLWQLGEHRLICGDCTDRATVERVMQSDKVEMVWTDPPYGVSVGDKNKYLNSIAPSNRIEENLENDTLDELGLIRMLTLSFDNVIANCLPGAAWYVAAPPGPLHILFGQILKDRGIWRQTIQWVKNNSTFSPMGVCYHWQAEPIFFGWLPNGGHRWYGGRKQTTVWEIDRPLASPEHPTMKPVELVDRAVSNSSRQGEIVIDPFVGSGTTLIACERLGRKCRAIEISPAYVSVALERFYVMTGVMPELIG